MAIRFQCTACQQPVEIDDEWASKPVACPYCRSTITAPESSTLPDLAEVPMAAPLGTASPGVLPPGPLHVHPGRNPAAVAAAALAAVMILQVIALLFVLKSNAANLRELEAETAKLTQQGVNHIAAQQQVMMKLLAKNGNQPPGWMMAVALLGMGGAATWLATVVCGVIAIRKPARRALAGGSLALAALTPVIICCGGGLWSG